jgi:TRAP transporter TAXI family solute receptor
MARFSAALCGSLALLLLHTRPADAQDTIDPGETGFGVKRPVLASACPNGCPWGELGDFVTEALAPFGYEVIQCRNCNRALGPPLVANASYPPELTGEDAVVGTTTRVNAPVDFGITSSSRLAWAFGGLYNYAEDGPYPNLRLIAKVEDPSYLLVAVKAESGITDLSQIAEQQLPVTILGGRSPISQPVLDHYGLTEEAVAAWGGAFVDATIAGFADDPAFDVLINENASPANNPEAQYWTKISQKHELRFLDLPEEVLDRLASDSTLGVQRAVVKWGFLRGVDRPIPTVARSGHAIFAREDTPDGAAYDVAKAIDQHRAALKWFIRPYSYDPKTAPENQGVPLHPGAARYYREAGALCSEPSLSPRGGCSVFAPTSKRQRGSILALWIMIALAMRKRLRRHSG